MKHVKALVTLLLLLLLLLLGNCSFGQANITLMTFNIRYDNPDDGHNAWSNRKKELINMLGTYRPDILGIQEGLEHQVNYIKDNLPEYEFIGVGRDDGMKKGEFSGIFFNKERWVNVKDGSLWLSETPDKVSVGWDAALPRIATYVVLANHIQGDTLFIVNTHFDHRGKTARVKSAHFLVNFVKSMAGEKGKLIFMGDLNALPDEDPIHVINSFLKDAAKIGGAQDVTKGTFNGFDPIKSPMPRIDYIFTRNVKTISYRVIEDRRNNNLFLSDHFPVLVVAEYPGE